MLNISTLRYSWSLVVVKVVFFCWICCRFTIFMCTTDINQIVQSCNCYLCRFTIFVLYLFFGYSDAKWCVSLTSLSIYGWIRWQLNVVDASFVHLTCWNFIAPGCPALQNLLDMVLLGLFSCDLDISTCLSQVTSFYRQCAKKFYHFIAALALDAYVIADTILFSLIVRSYPYMQQLGFLYLLCLQV